MDTMTEYTGCDMSDAEAYAYIVGASPAWCAWALEVVDADLEALYQVKREGGNDWYLSGHIAQTEQYRSLLAAEASMA